MRISAGSRGLSRNGGNIHVHPEIPFITIRPTIKQPINQSVPRASLEIRNAVFQELIRISPASNYMEELVAGPGGLLSRGLLERHATSYGALPRTKQQRATLAGILNDYVGTNFPEHAESHSGAGVVGIPGFWQELSGVVHIWKPRNYHMPLLVVPHKDANGLIQACQIRLHANDISSRLVSDCQSSRRILTRVVCHYRNQLTSRTSSRSFTLSGSIYGPRLRYLSSSARIVLHVVPSKVFHDGTEVD